MSRGPVTGPSSSPPAKPPMVASPADLSTSEAIDLRIVEGDVWAFFAINVGNAIDVDAAQRILQTATRVREAALAHVSGGHADGDERMSREEIRHRRRSGSATQFHPAPLRVDQPTGAIADVDLAGHRLASRVECTVYDFGAVSVGYRIPVVDDGDGLPFDAIVPLSQAIIEGSELRDDAIRRVTELASRLRSAIDGPEITSIVEDYTIVHLRRWQGKGESAMDDVMAAASTVARVLIAEPGALSNHAIAAATSARTSYAPNDAAVIDWNGALLLGPEEEDSITILEFANVELLEMRLLDDRLDAALDRAYASLLKRDRRGRPSRSPLGLIFDPHRTERRWLADLQMESAVLFENANNTLKLIGDQHLARLYAMAAQRLHIADWDNSILRKLETVEGLYQKLADEQAARRMEFLEWIIIILIAISIVLPFIPGVKY